MEKTNQQKNRKEKPQKHHFPRRHIMYTTVTTTKIVSNIMCRQSNAFQRRAYLISRLMHYFLTRAIQWHWQLLRYLLTETPTTAHDSTSPTEPKRPVGLQTCSSMESHASLIIGLLLHPTQFNLMWQNLGVFVNYCINFWKFQEISYNWLHSVVTNRVLAKHARNYTQPVAPPFKETDQYYCML